MSQTRTSPSADPRPKPSPAETGIVFFPLIFGLSPSARRWICQLEQKGYAVRVVNYFKNGTPYPPFPPLANRFANDMFSRQHEIFDQTERELQILREEGRSRQVLLGLGGGANLAAAYAQLRQALPVAAMYLHLHFPKSVTQASEPDLEAITAPILLQYTEGDNVTDSVRTACRQAAIHGHVRVKVHDDPGLRVPLLGEVRTPVRGVFFDSHLGRFRSPLYRRSVADQAMQEVDRWMGGLDAAF